jgi:hypothetical protein
MRARGITYDTGFVRNGTTSRRHYDHDVVRRELEIIRDDLHCDAVQITGGDADRLEVAARIAADLGLEVWFSPYPLELTTGEVLDLLADCAERAEQIRISGAEVVFVAGVEMSIMNRGFVAGEDVAERLSTLIADPAGRPERIAEVSKRLDTFLREAATTVRARFGGRTTYAAVPFEQIDWSPFDVVTVELIRSAEVADRFRDGVRGLVAGTTKPVAITGFGTATWRGAGETAPRSMEIIEYDAAGRPCRLDGEYVRDEEGQAAYLRELLDVFDSEGVDSAFVFLFALENLPHRPGGDPQLDLDLASLGIVKVLESGGGTTYPGMAWEPKAAFAMLAERASG